VRAPTPTGAAEMVVPVRVELMAGVNDLGRRHVESVLRIIDRRRSDLRSTARALPTPDALFSAKRQRLDLAATKLYPGLARNARGHEEELLKLSRRLANVSPVASVARMRARLDAVDDRPLKAVERMIESRTEKLDHMRQRLSAARAALLRAEITRINQRRDLVVGLAERLEPALAGQIGRKADRLNAVAHLFDSLNYKSVLKRGFALVRDADGQPLRSADAVTDGQALVLEFADGKADAMGGRGVARPKVLKPKLVVAEEQGALF
jgi:exodeoxyribonuclease VII large subunit